MSNLIFTLLASIGMTYIVTQGSIFYPVRNYITRKSNANNDEGFWGWILELVICPQCMAFWSGMIVEGLKAMSSETSTLLNPFWLSMFLTGCATSGCVSFLPKLIRGE